MSNRILKRLGGAVVAFAALLGAAEATTAPVLVVDVDSGKVIYGQAATDPWFPASITKLMTAYVALDLVRQGRASLDTLVTISQAAAAEPPSKMGFRPGTQLTLDNALKIIMVKSANDVAWAIGESLGGSVEGFSDMMNETGRRIGMRESRWYNPNGLPDPRQWTSARDMAVLGRALMRDFPEHRDLFAISAIQFGKSVMANHNGLLGRYAGADGMKTGFICSGGFNVVASATRNGRRIIAVVMGQPSARERDLKTADLFDSAFAQSAGWTSPTLDALPASASPAPPDMRPFICGGRKAPAIDEGPGAIAGNGAEGAIAQFMGQTATASPAAAMAAFSSAAMRNRALPPRAPLQPIAVWIGRNPAEGQTLLAEQENAAKTAAAEARAAKLEAAKAKREAAREAARQAKEARSEKARAAQAEAASPKPASTKSASTKQNPAAVAAKPKPAAVAGQAAPKAAARRAQPQSGVPQSATAYTSTAAEASPIPAKARTAAKPAQRAAAQPKAAARKPKAEE